VRRAACYAVSVAAIGLGVVVSWVALVLSWERSVHRTINPRHVHLE
jgi:hypothetical protein